MVYHGAGGQLLSEGLALSAITAGTFPEVRRTCSDTQLPSTPTDALVRGKGYETYTVHDSGSDGIGGAEDMTEDDQTAPHVDPSRQLGSNGTSPPSCQCSRQH